MLGDASLRRLLLLDDKYTFGRSCAQRAAALASAHVDTVANGRSATASCVAAPHAELKRAAVHRLRRLLVSRNTSRPKVRHRPNRASLLFASRDSGLESRCRRARGSFKSFLNIAQV